MKAPSELSATELRDELLKFGFKIGPIVDSTRPMLEKKLAAFRSGGGSVKANTSGSARSRRQSPRTSPIVTTPPRSIANSTIDSNSSVLSSAGKTNPTESTRYRRPSPRKLSIVSTPPSLTADSTVGFNSLVSPNSSVSSTIGRTPRTSPTDSVRFRRPSPRRTQTFTSPRSWVTDSTFDFNSSVPSPVVRTRQLQQQQNSPIGQVPKWIMICVFSFTSILLLAYMCTAYPKTVNRGRRVLTAAVYDTASFLFNYAVFPVLIALSIGSVGFAAFFVYKNRKAGREQFERQTVELVDKIADRVRDAGSSGIAEQHIRDSLFPPTRRTERDEDLWNNAVDFVNNLDSRMRAENRVINGVECNVWVWVNTHDTSQGYHGLAEHSPQPSRVPDHALTRCLKIRGLIDSNRSEDQIVKQEVYAKLRPAVPAHFAIVRSNEPCVYLMFRELAAAKKAFDTFHTQWIRGNLVSVKYVRDDRYYERFPEITI